MTILGREYGGFYSNQSLHLLISLINTPDRRELISEISRCSLARGPNSSTGLIMTTLGLQPPTFLVPVKCLTVLFKFLGHPHTHLKHGAVDDAADGLGVLPPLRVGPARVRGRPPGGRAVGRGELAGEGGDTALHVSLGGGEVIVLIPGQRAAQPSDLERRTRGGPDSYHSAFILSARDRTHANGERLL